MRAWIARDAVVFGANVSLFAEEPKWNRGYWAGYHLIGFEKIDIATAAANLEPEHKQPIELTARPVGAAEGGES